MLELRSQKKIVLSISIILWLPASQGPGDFNKADAIVQQENAGITISEEAIETKIASFKLEHSYIGHAGKFIEPALVPLGYDWKIGIALISSFAAREVFLGRLATIYSVGNDDVETIKNRMAAETNVKTGEPPF